MCIARRNSFSRDSSFRSLPRSRFKVIGHALYDCLLIGFALRGRAKVNLGRVYDRKKLSTEIGDAPISRYGVSSGDSRRDIGGLRSKAPEPWGAVLWGPWLFLPRQPPALLLE